VGSPSTGTAIVDAATLELAVLCCMGWKHKDTEMDTGINCAVTQVMVVVLTLMAALGVEKQGRIVVPQDWCWRYMLDCLQLVMLLA
jgi:hypothetical protein